MNNIWNVLGIEPTRDKKIIRERYAKLAKQFHMEEKPEEFANIQKAYQEALAYAKAKIRIESGERQKDEESTGEQSVNQWEEKEKRKDSPESILDMMRKMRQNLSPAYSRGQVLEEMLMMLQTPETAHDRKGWQQFFLSDRFLAVYREEGFVEELVSLLEAGHVDGAPSEAMSNEFLSELALVYGIVRFEDMEYISNQNKANMAKLLLNLNHSQWVKTQGDEQRVARSFSYLYFDRLCQLAKEGGLRNYNQSQWGNLSLYAEDEFVADTPIEKAPLWQDKIELMIEPHLPTLVAMHRFLIKHYPISENMCNIMRENYEVDGRIGGYPLCSYEPVYEQMCKRYPSMKESENALLIEWKKSLLAKNPVFEKYTLTAELADWLIRFLTMARCKKEIVEQIYEAYKDEGEKALPLLEAVIGKINQYKNETDRRLSSSEFREKLKITLQNRYFWSYFFSMAYPYSNDQKEYGEEDYHRFFSKYMEKVYPMSNRFNKLFSGSRIELRLKNHSIKLIFARHHVEYYIDENRVFYQTLSFKEVAALTESEEDIICFFLLLPITQITSGKACEKEVLKRIKYLPFHESTWRYIAGCLVHNRDWKPAEQHEQKVLQEVYYAENEWHCFRGALTGRSFIVDYKTPDGWHNMKLLNGESKAVRSIGNKAERIDFMHKVVDKFLPPKEVLLKEVCVKAMTAEEKAEVVFRLFLEKNSYVCGKILKIREGISDAARKFIEMTGGNLFKSTGDSITLWFGDEAESLPVIFYLLVRDGHDTKRTLFDFQGEEKNTFIKREEKLRRRIGEEAEVIGFFRMEGMIPFPLAVGESGRFYSYCHHQLICGSDFVELMGKCIDFTELEKIHIYRGSRTKGLYVHKLESWYEHSYNRETQEVEYNYPFELYNELFKEL